MDNLWNYIDDRKLVLDISGVHHSALCVICDGLLRNASYTKCGCRFCAKCIGDYLSSGGGHLCPGCLKKGTTTDLSEDSEVVFDSMDNMDVTKLRLKCPHVGCSVTCEIGSLLEHLESCEFTQLQMCMFCEVGCDKGPMEEDELILHMQGNHDEHGYLISRFVKQSREKEEQLNQLNRQYEELKSEMTTKFQMETSKSDVKKKVELQPVKKELSGKCEEISLGEINLSYEWRIVDLKAYMEHGNQFGDVFNLGGYSFCFLVDVFKRNSITHARANLVLYHCDDVTLEWPLRRDLWIMIVDPVTNSIAMEKKFGLEHSTKYRSDYRKPSSKKILWDSEILIRPYHFLSSWNNQLLILRFEMAT